MRRPSANKQRVKQAIKKGQFLTLPLLQELTSKNELIKTELKIN
jgi:hypothetical protein